MKALGRGAASLLATALAAATLAGGAAAAPVVGFADDATKFADDGGAQLFGTLHEVGAVENRVAVYWDPADPTTIQQQDFLDRMLPVAAANGVQIVFSVYPRSPLTFATDTDTRVAQFAAYLHLLAVTYPQVRTYEVLNEPNEAYFFAPQHGPDGEVISAEVAYKVLAAGYDALKSVDPSISVAGLGLSPAANDRTSTSPIRFLTALGQAYRASGRQTPIMDELDVHIYPDDASRQDENTHYAWPQIGPGDFDRVKQAVWDAFAGTGQPVFQEAGQQGPFLKLRIGEIGWQVGVLPSLASQYVEAENVKVTDETRQARIYAALVRRFGCDPSVSAIDFFHLIDDRDLIHYQSALLRVDGTPRPAFDAVRDAIRQPCARTTPWAHATTVLSPRATLDTGRKPNGTAALKLTVSAGEDADVTVAILKTQGRLTPAQADQALASGLRGVTVLGSGKSFIKGGGRMPVNFSGALAPGTYVIAVRMTAAASDRRSTTAVSQAFVIAG
jgi:hypothetical protein